MVTSIAQQVMPEAAAHPAVDDCTTVDIPILLSRKDCVGGKPVTFGVPLPRGLYHDDLCWTVYNNRTPQAACQTTVLSRWPDGTCKWLLVTFVLKFTPDSENDSWTLRGEVNSTAMPAAPPIISPCSNNGLFVDTGVFHARLDRGTSQL